MVSSVINPIQSHTPILSMDPELCSQPITSLNFKLGIQYGLRPPYCKNPPLECDTESHKLCKKCF
jgi:hypothetical protein